MRPAEYLPSLRYASQREARMLAELNTVREDRRLLENKANDAIGRGARVRGAALISRIEAMS